MNICSVLLHKCSGWNLSCGTYMAARFFSFTNSALVDMPEISATIDAIISNLGPPGGFTPKVGHLAQILNWTHL